MFKLRKAVLLLCLLYLSLVFLFSQSAYASEGDKAPKFISGKPAGEEFFKTLPEEWRPKTDERLELWPGERFTDKNGQVFVNCDIPVLDVCTLGFSDHPERVSSRGKLFSGGLIPFKPLRFQLYHEGGRENNDLWLKLKIFNSGSEKCRIHIIEGCGGPDADYFQAGHENNVNFLQNSVYNCGRILEINPKDEAVLFCRQLPYEQVLSITEQFTLLEGSDVSFTLFSLQDPEETESCNLLSKETDVHARGVYPCADHFIYRSFDLSKEDYAYAVIGSVRQPNTLQGQELKGDYGVMYAAEFLIINPEWGDQNFDLIFNPRGGKATISVMAQAEALRMEHPENWIKGRIPSMPFFLSSSAPWRMVQTKKEVEAMVSENIASFTVPKSSCLIVRLLTVPEGASNYPVRLILKRCGSTKEIKVNHI